MKNVVDTDFVCEFAARILRRKFFFSFEEGKSGTNEFRTSAFFPALISLCDGLFFCFFTGCATNFGISVNFPRRKKAKLKRNVEKKCLGEGGREQDWEKLILSFVFESFFVPLFREMQALLKLSSNS